MRIWRKKNTSTRRLECLLTGNTLNFYRINTESDKALPPVPQWWWDYGMQKEIDKQLREAIDFDKAISESIKAMNKTKQE